jgi:hypothetical protein
VNFLLAFPVETGRMERCPSGLRSTTGNRVSAERWIAGSNPALSGVSITLSQGVERKERNVL